MNGVAYLVAPGTSTAVVYEWLYTIPVIVGSRLVLNLHKAQAARSATSRPSRRAASSVTARDMDGDITLVEVSSHSAGGRGKSKAKALATLVGAEAAADIERGRAPPLDADEGTDPFAALGDDDDDDTCSISTNASLEFAPPPPPPRPVAGAPSADQQSNSGRDSALGDYVVYEPAGGDG
jgi:hypothetical protein